MKFEKIKKEYSKKIKKIHEYNKSYYDENNSLISDQEYDNLITILANKFVKDYGAPNIHTAIPVAKEEIEFMKRYDEYAMSCIESVSAELIEKATKICHAQGIY